MNLIFTCGGTAGHINPAIAVANCIKERHPEAKILFIGAKGHMEETLVPQAGYEVSCLPGSGLSRGKNLKAVRQNLHAVKCVLDAVSSCKKIFREFQPDVVVGTGGYASFPALYAAQTMKIPTCVHESNALPGVTTKMVARRADKVLVAFEESRGYYKEAEVVGMPVQKAFLTTTKEQARERLGISQTDKVLLTAFGSLGAKVMNETVADMIPMEAEQNFPYRHIHATGKFGKEWMPQRVENNGVSLENAEKLDIREYIYDMPLTLTAADLVIGRAGSATCNEIAAAGVPAILVPSPNVTANHQEKNARLLEAAGGAVVLLEKDLTAQRLFALVEKLMADESRRAEMSRKLKAMARKDSAERICDIIETLIGSETPV